MLANMHARFVDGFCAVMNTHTPSSDAPGEMHMSICNMLAYLLNSLNNHTNIDSAAEMYTNFLSVFDFNCGQKR